MSEYRNDPRQNDGCRDCNDKDNPTQKTITRERNAVCNLLYESSGEMSKQEEKFTKERELYDLRKCLFVNTEDNFRRYRNMDIVVGSELVQTNESVKGNVAALNKWNKDLSAALKNIAKGIKDAKAKFAELRKAANDLKNCMEDSCNKAQRKALTGKVDDCKEEGKIPPECKDSGTILDELVCIPQGLGFDIDSIFKSSYDVVGIQVFSNIETLEPLQKVLDEQAKAFKGHLGDVTKLREGDLKAQQVELVKSVQEITKAAMERNNARSNFEGYYDAVDFLCCPKCKCVKKDNGDRKAGCDDCEPRLGQCEKDICTLCEEVKHTFCCTPKDQGGKSTAS